MESINARLGGGLEPLEPSSSSSSSSSSPAASLRPQPISRSQEPAAQKALNCSIREEHSRRGAALNLLLSEIPSSSGPEELRREPTEMPVSRVRGLVALVSGQTVERQDRF